MWNGTCNNPETCPLGTEAPGGSQANGGVDDYNGDFQGYAPPPDRYATTWTQCTSGNDYCGTGDPGASAEDTATNLVWSYPCHDTTSTVGCAVWDTSAPDLGNCHSGNCNYNNNDTHYSWNNSGSKNNNLTAQQLCSSTANHGSGWYLPDQKQLLQAYIDGDYGNLEPVGVLRQYWSATTYSNGMGAAWHVGLSYGYTNVGAKSASDVVRCVRPAM
jgi:hypothetical protein